MRTRGIEAIVIARVVQDNKKPFKTGTVGYQIYYPHTRSQGYLDRCNLNAFMMQYRPLNAIYDKANNILKQKSNTQEIETIVLSNISTTAGVVRNKGITVSTVKHVTSYKPRFCFRQLCDRVFDKSDKRVVALSGLRRTGKTVLLNQLFMKAKEKGIPVASVNITKGYGTTMDDLYSVMDSLVTKGYRLILIDEITFLADFQSKCNKLADKYSVDCGVKVVLAGTYSLGLAISQYDNLYDRVVTIDTSYISYKEYKYLKQGNLSDYMFTACPLMSDDEVSDYNKLHNYINTSIVDNIVYSFKAARHISEYKPLVEIHERRGDIKPLLFNVIDNFCFDNLDAVCLNKANFDRILKSAIQIYESRNIEIANKESVTADILAEYGYLINIERRKLTEDITDAEVEIFRHFLQLLSFLSDFNRCKCGFSPMVIQFGMVGVVTKHLVNAIKQSMRGKWSNELIDIISDIILHDVSGRLLEDIIQYDTYLATSGNSEVKFITEFRWEKYRSAEIDMVVVKDCGCELYEIKNSDKIVKNQSRWLRNTEVINEVSRLYGKVIKRAVIYRGKSEVVNIEGTDIEYINAEGYLEGLRTGLV